MSLIIHQFTSDEVQRDDPTIFKTIALAEGANRVYQLVVTIENLVDKKHLQLVIDSIISNYSWLLPDYRRLELPYNERTFIMVSMIEHIVCLYVLDEKALYSYSFDYEVPIQLRRPLPVTERDNNTFLGPSN